MGAAKEASAAAMSGQSATGPPSSSSSGRLGGDRRRSCLSSRLCKTKMCEHHSAGACQYGGACAFAHSSAELHSVPDLRKTRLCKAYEQGECNSQDCAFAHGEEELRSALFYKKALCVFNQKGRCRNGDQCKFAHGTSELRTNKGDSGSQGSHGDMPASGEEGAAKGSNKAKLRKQPMEVPAEHCFPRQRRSRHRSLTDPCGGGVPIPGPPFLSDTYSRLNDFTLRDHDAATDWWQWWLPFGMMSPMPNMMPEGAGIESLKADLERLRHTVLGQDVPSDLAPDLERIREDVESLTHRCNEIQKKMEVTQSSLSAGYLKDADMTTLGSYLKVPPDLVVSREVRLTRSSQGSSLDGHTASNGSHGLKGSGVAESSEDCESSPSIR